MIRPLPILAAAWLCLVALSASQAQSVNAVTAATAPRGIVPFVLSPGGVQSAGAFGAFLNVAPGSWIEIFGSALASKTRSWAGSDFNGANAPTSLDGTTVTIGGQPAFIAYISPTQINAQIPSTVLPGQQPVIISTPGGSSTPYYINVVNNQPGLLAPPSFNILGKRYVVALYPDGVTYALDPAAIPGLRARLPKAGDQLTLYGIGFGSVNPNIPAGQIVRQSNSLSLPIRFFVGGAEATVNYAGLAPNVVGLYQFNITLPTLPLGDALAFTYTLGGIQGWDHQNFPYCLPSPNLSVGLALLPEEQRWSLPRQDQRAKHCDKNRQVLSRGEGS